METQKTPYSQSTPEKEKSWRNQALWLQTILQSYSNKNKMMLTQKQIFISMEQNRKSRNKPTHHGKGGKRIYSGEKTISSINGGGKI